MICEVEPTSDHADYSVAIAVIDQSHPHAHRVSTEEYEVMEDHIIVAGVKTLKFKPNLADLIRKGEKVSTWRLFDDKDLQEGDLIGLCENGIEAAFAIAVITRVVEKPLGSLEESDWVGHERFASDDEMYQTYRKYYGPSVGQDTLVKIIWFERQ